MYNEVMKLKKDFNEVYKGNRYYSHLKSDIQRAPKNIETYFINFSVGDTQGVQTKLLKIRFE